MYSKLILHLETSVDICRHDRYEMILTHLDVCVCAASCCQAMHIGISTSGEVGFWPEGNL